MMNIQWCWLFAGIQRRCGDDNGRCSHLCLPNPTGYTCHCPTGIRFDPVNKTCSEGRSKS